MRQSVSAIVYNMVKVNQVAIPIAMQITGDYLAEVVKEKYLEQMREHEDDFEFFAEGSQRGIRTGALHAGYIAQPVSKRGKRWMVRVINNDEKADVYEYGGQCVCQTSFMGTRKNGRYAGIRMLHRRHKKGDWFNVPALYVGKTTEAAARMDVENKLRNTIEGLTKT
jgi:hypothetical protein